MDNQPPRLGYRGRYVAWYHVSPPLRRFESESSLGRLECWHLASIQITRTAARAVLGEPHHVEKDSRATAGGTEDHWIFCSPDALPAFFRLRVPYNTMDLCSSTSDFPADSWDWVNALFPKHEVERLDVPFNESAHPDDAT